MSGDRTTQTRKKKRRGSVASDASGDSVEDRRQKAESAASSASAPPTDYTFEVHPDNDEGKKIYKQLGASDGERVTGARLGEGNTQIQAYSKPKKIKVDFVNGERVEDRSAYDAVAESLHARIGEANHPNGFPEEVAFDIPEGANLRDTLDNILQNTKMGKLLLALMKVAKDAYKITGLETNASNGTATFKIEKNEATEALMTGIRGGNVTSRQLFDFISSLRGVSDADVVKGKLKALNEGNPDSLPNGATSRSIDAHTTLVSRLGADEVNNLINQGVTTDALGKIAEADDDGVNLLDEMNRAGLDSATINEVAGDIQSFLPSALGIPSGGKASFTRDVVGLIKNYDVATVKKFADAGADSLRLLDRLKSSNAGSGTVTTVANNIDAIKPRIGSLKARQDFITVAKSLKIQGTANLLQKLPQGTDASFLLKLKNNSHQLSARELGETLDLSQRLGLDANQIDQGFKNYPAASLATRKNELGRVALHDIDKEKKLSEWSSKLNTLINEGVFNIKLDTTHATSGKSYQDLGNGTLEYKFHITDSNGQKISGQNSNGRPEGEFVLHHHPNGAPASVGAPASSKTHLKPHSGNNATNRLYNATGNISILTSTMNNLITDSKHHFKFGR
ncbi:hypothetical protein [uncultured Microscilla sp.]|uniref:hypothetical protein n=1 Tax=uncultured Microscilla sp. TaxID=432653 RepID=UPI00263A0F67|nr:hypothetical protein [uncultured Microscilla sp.]